MTSCIVLLAAGTIAKGLQRLQAAVEPAADDGHSGAHGKGYGLGSAEARNATHQEKKLADKALTAFRSRFEIPILKKRARWIVVSSAGRQSGAGYLRQRRKELGGYMPTGRCLTWLPGAAAE